MYGLIPQIYSDNYDNNAIAETRGTADTGRKCRLQGCYGVRSDNNYILVKDDTIGPGIFLRI